MKIFAILVSIVAVCSALKPVIRGTECCPDPPLAIGLGLSCIPCTTPHPSYTPSSTPIPFKPFCCPKYWPKIWGIGPACIQCTTERPSCTPPSTTTTFKLGCCPNPPMNPKFGHGPACRPCAKPLNQKN